MMLNLAELFGGRVGVVFFGVGIVCVDFFLFLIFCFL